VRVSGGVARGRTLTVPAAIRPSTDRVRQSIFNTLVGLVVIEGRGLDLYAGSGALGIEALSRGLDRCDFVEQRGAACQAIRENLRRTGFADQAEVICMAAARASTRLRGPYRLVFADPPYADDSALAPLASLGPLLEPESVIVVEHAGRREPPESLAGRLPLARKRYGDSAITFYGKED
jgi:16S rRNA (guanine966-N2)-methyltransferase